MISAKKGAAHITVSKRYGLRVHRFVVLLSIVVSLSLLASGSPAAGQSATPEQIATQHDLEAISQAAASWITDQVFRSTGPSPPPLNSCGKPPVDVTDVPPISAQDLENLLVPFYIASLPEFDAWGEPFEFRLLQALGTPSLAIRSSGPNGTFEGSIYSGGTVTVSEDDLVHVDGQALRDLPFGPEEAQARTVVAIRNTGAAMMGWITDQLDRRESPPGPPRGTGIDLATFVPISVQDLRSLLVPLFASCIPDTDGWGNPFDYYLDQENLLGPHSVLGMRSLGRDGVADSEGYSSYWSYPGWQQEHDLVWVDGSWYQVPDPEISFNHGYESGDFVVWSLVQAP